MCCLTPHRTIFTPGELAKAQLAAEHGIALAASRHDLVYQWKFRLLRCEILLNSSRAEEVLNQLHDAVPHSAGVRGAGGA